jgi:3-oxoacyl-[acyl-carrier protein] reductase
MEDRQSLRGKTMIVTGASRGIGRAIAIRLAGQGACCVLSARSGEGLAAVQGEIAGDGGAAWVLPLDLRDPETPARLVEFAVAKCGRIDAVVNNAGATRRGDFLALSEEDWRDGFALKFFGAMRLARAAWAHLKQSSGSLLFIAGVGGRTPGPEFAIGGSVNAALLSLTKSLADAGTRDGIRVNAINPGTIRTQRFQSRLEALSADTGMGPESAEREYVRKAGITRVGEPEDVANLAAFVLGPQGTLLHGAILDIDGGATKSL